MLKEIILPYISKIKKELGLPGDQITCLILDAFKAQSTETVKLVLENLNIKDVQVPKNITRLLQPIDLTTNGLVKKMGQREFSNYFTTCITDTMLKDPKRDVTTIKVYLKLPTLKPLNAKTVCKVYQFLKADEGKKTILNGFRAVGIMDTLRKTRLNSVVDSLYPYL